MSSEVTAVNDAKKGRPGAAPPRQPTERHPSGEKELSQIYDNTSEHNTQSIFQSLLQRGAENAIRAQDLANMLGLSDARTVSELIAREREAGAVILSDSRGYFLPADGEQGRYEAARFISTLRARAINTLRATKSAKAFLNDLPGQMCVDGEDGGGVNV